MNGFYGMIGNSPEMQRVYKDIELSAKADIPVLIQGETGTGKELASRAIHECSGRISAAFIPVNCAAIPRELAESELFGHERGAFTSAHRDRKGKIELANKGSIFLDEIGDMDIFSQAKLLRVLEEGTITRVGSEKPISVNTRVISATNKQLVNNIQKKTFREDLYYRLATFQIFLPALRERRSDIPFLAEYFLSKANDQFQKDVTTVHPNAMERLVEHNWPGNVREFKNIITRAVISCKGSYITLDDIAISLPYLDRIKPNTSVLQDPMWLSFSNETSLNTMEKEAIRKMLGNNQGNKRKTAEALGIGRSSLYWKLKRYGLS
ncbi:sigma-54-dependent Fis family transcriptional regulator [Candidatus Desantisbacteria bacterium]|nr:sigma-54-dependent Fis family transcriptional regulator [Candidatus Desantisbacteria bacterium]